MMKDPEWLVHLRDHLWSRSAFEESDRWGRRRLIAGRGIYLVFDSLRRDDVQVRAGSLTVVTLISLVPALAVIFSLLTAFTSLEQVARRIRDFVLQSLSVGDSGAIGAHLDRFITNTNTGAIGGIGLLLLFFSALSLLSNIETTFNQIWGVKRGRTLLARFQVYWPLITVGPLMLGISLSATTAVTTSSAFRTLLRQVPFLHALTLLTPFIAAGLFFGLLYRIVPNAKVRTGPALIGGALAGALWVLAQRLFTLYATHAISYSQIYGSLGAIPLFILSVYLSWIVILFGANLVFAIQTARSSERPGIQQTELSVRDRERLAMLLAAQLALRFNAGDGATRVSELESAGWPSSSVRRTIDDMMSAGLILEVESGDAEDPGYVPSRSPFSMTERDVVDAIRSRCAVPEEELALGELARAVIEAQRSAEQEYLAALDHVGVPPS